MRTRLSTCVTEAPRGWCWHKGGGKVETVMTKDEAFTDEPATTAKVLATDILNIARKRQTKIKLVKIIF